MLQERGHLTREQFRRVMAAAARPSVARSAADEVFGRLCIRRKRALGYQVRRGLEERDALARRGEPGALRDILVAQGALTPEQAAELDRERETFLLCPACGVLLDARGEPPGTRLACPRCDLVLPAVPSPARPPGEDAERAARLRGHKVGRWQLIREIGKGATGVVYEARDSETGKPAAVKILPETAGADPAAAERIRREAELASRLDHPAIVPLLGFGEEDGAFYLAMEFVEGETLDALPHPVPLPPATAAKVAAQVAQGLEHAHRKGIIHRDVKPGNIMVDRSGNARILDFGLAKRRDVATITASGAIVGTPMYMSPEQATPGAAIDFRTDLYSLGATLYECLTGVPPFTGDNVQTVIRRVKTRDPLPPRSIRPDIPAALENIVLKALAKDPAGRYASAADMEADLRRFLEEGIAHARPPGVWERARRAAGRRQEAIAAGLLAAAVLAGGAIVWHLSSSAPPSPRPGPGADERSHALASEAFAQYRLGRLEEAVALASKVLETAPLDPDGLYYRALSWRGLGRPDRALEDLGRLLDAHPSFLKGRLERAELFLEAGRPAEASRDLETYLSARPGAVEAQILLGKARRLAGDRLGALKALERALAGDPGNGEAALALAELELEADPGKARGRLAALAASPEAAPGTHLLLGKALLACGDPEGALRAFLEEVRRHGETQALREEIERARRLAGR
jgi:serine/threonine protein kinase